MSFFSSFMIKYIHILVTFQLCHAVKNQSKSPMKLGYMLRLLLCCGLWSLKKNTHTHTHIYIHIHIHIRIYTHIHTYIYTHIHRAVVVKLEVDKL